MDQEHLGKMLKSASVHRKIIGDYTGAYSIGITLNPKNKQQLAIRLRVEDKNVDSFPHFIRLEKEVVPVIINEGFTAPSAAMRNGYRLTTRRVPKSRTP